MNITQFFTPSNLKDNLHSLDFDVQDHVDKSRMLIWFIIITSFSVGVYLLKHYTDNFYTYLPIYYIAIPSHLLNLFFYKLKGNYVVSANIFILCLELTFFALMLFSGGFQSMVIYWLPGIPIATVFLLGTRWGFVWTSVSVALNVFAGWAVATSLVKTYQIPAEIISTDCTATIIVGAFTYLSITYLYYTRKEASILKLNEKNRQFLKAIADKKHLLAILYHDISDPLTLIHGKTRFKDFNSLAFNEKDKKNIKNRFSTIQKATVNMFDIIGEVKKLESLEVDSIALVPTLINFREHLGSAITAMSDKFKNKDITIKTEFPEGFCDKILAGPVSIQHSIFTNILSNAHKFSYRGSKIVITGENLPDWTKIIFSDSGCGID
ncbi:MAG: HAMP domain-containing histidine kinase, partial [Candidatus Brocadiales bacterium]|nr:HAMP domain-containing histidine kinase [Candidatus Brocadiales bacterium]